MADDQTLRELFPVSLDAIPAPFRVSMPIEQREYLLNGQLRQWSGPMQEVLSPICLRNGDSLKPQVLGHYPRLTEKEALAALAAASQAFDNGRGAWPTMAVSDRIRHVEDFVFRIKAKRTEVVNLLMWEIG